MKITWLRKSSTHADESWSATNGYGFMTESKLVLKRLTTMPRFYWLIGILFLVIVATFLLGGDFSFEKHHSNGYKSLQDSFPWWWWPVFLGLCLIAYTVSRFSAIAGFLLGTLMLLTPFILPFVTDLHKVLNAFSWPLWLLYFVGIGSLFIPAGKVGIDEALKKLRKDSNDID